MWEDCDRSEIGAGHVQIQLVGGVHKLLFPLFAVYHLHDDRSFLCLSTSLIDIISRNTTLGRVQSASEFGHDVWSTTEYGIYWQLPPREGHVVIKSWDIFRT